MKLASWDTFAAAMPDMAERGRALLYQGSDIASAFLATVSAAGNPRLHPVCPVIGEGDLWLFIVNLGPKYKDLQTNGRFALHSSLVPGGGQEFYIRGRAEEVPEPETKARVVAATEGRQGGLDFEALFRCRLQHALVTTWANWGTAETWPTFEKWAAS
jgi:hypothetical protein